MTMTKYGSPGHIDEFTSGGEDEAIICKACSRIIVSKVNLKDDKYCPYCHNDAFESLEEEKKEENIDAVAQSC